MSTKIATLYAEIGAKIDSFQSGAKQVKSGLGGIAGDFATTALKAVTLTAVISGARKAFEETVGVTVEYANEVRTLSQISGEAAEETSKLIQVTDDYKLSTTDLMTAQRQLAKEGYSLTLETIAQLSDEYLKLNSGAERQQFLTENLGRSSAAWAEIMSQGSAKIIASSEGISEALILDQEALDQARAYELEFDELTDSVLALKVAAGTRAIPIVVELIKKFTTTTTTFPELEPGFEALQNQWIRSSRTYKEYKEANREFYNSLAWGEKLVLGAATNLDPVSKREYENIRNLGDGYKRTATEMAIAAAWSDDYKRSLEGVVITEEEAALAAEEFARAQEQLQKSIIEGTSWQVAFTGAKDAAEQAKLSMELLGTSIEGISAEGAAVWNGFLSATGEISPAAAEQFVKIQNAFLIVKRMLDNGISVPVVVNWLVNQSGLGPGGSTLSTTPAPEEGGQHGIVEITPPPPGAPDALYPGGDMRDFARDIVYDLRRANG